MAQKKNLWQRLFSSADDEEMGLSVAERNAIQESLKSEYGLTIQQDNVTASELTTRNYRKLTGEEVSRINQIFQFIPQIAANSANQQAVNAAFKAATEGTYVGLWWRSHLYPVGRKVWRKLELLQPWFFCPCAEGSCKDELSGEG